MKDLKKIVLQLGASNLFEVQWSTLSTKTLLMVNISVNAKCMLGPEKKDKCGFSTDNTEYRLIRSDNSIPSISY